MEENYKIEEKQELVNQWINKLSFESIIPLFSMFIVGTIFGIGNGKSKEELREDIKTLSTEDRKRIAQNMRKTLLEYKIQNKDIEEKINKFEETGDLL